VKSGKGSCSLEIMLGCLHNPEKTGAMGLQSEGGPMQIIVAVAVTLMGCTTAAYALVSCDDAVSVRQREMDEYCLPEDVKKRHDAECVSLGLNRETERFFRCRKSKAELYRNRELLMQLQERDQQE
jgi:hypothetical protein